MSMLNTPMTNIEIEIDGKLCKAEPNAMVIQVADAEGIYIPRFCYHKHLSVAANCRMCLVEVEKSPKVLPACATPVTPGMKVFTRSAKALAAQKAVMEFLLINHPLDCPICDQGGECELQDLSLGYGAADSSFVEGKRAVYDHDIGPLIATDMTRCIQCTRCVRFGAEIAGLRELGAVGRGEDMEITTYIAKAIHSNVSGNIIDLCPVGALTSKPYRFTARPWELNQHQSIAPHDCLGSHIFVHTRYGKVMRVVPRENNAINETWLSDRDRFSYQALYHEDRIKKPLIRVNNTWQTVDWQTAFDVILKNLQRVLNTHGVDQLGALASPSSTLEEFFLLQKWMRALGSSNIDHRLRQIDMRDQAEAELFPALPISLTELEQSDVIVLVGSNIQAEQPMAGLRIRKAVLKGAKVISLNCTDDKFPFDVAIKQIVSPDELIKSLTGIVKVLEDARDKKIVILLGAVALNHPNAAVLRALCDRIANLTGAKIGFMTEGANAAGAWLAGAIPHRAAGGASVKQSGLDAQAMLNNPRKAYVLLNVEPEDCAQSDVFVDALKQAECVVALSLFQHPVLEKHAHVILPIAPFTETAGTYVNAMGDWQSFNGVASAWEDSRPAWKILRVLGNVFQLAGFDYASFDEIRDEVKSELSSHRLTPASRSTFDIQNESKSIVNVSPYAIDSLVRRASSLQKTEWA